MSGLTPSPLRKRKVTKREFKFTSPTAKTPQKRIKAKDANPTVGNAEQKSNENTFDLPPPIWASSPRDTPYTKFKSKRPKKLLEISHIEPVSLKTTRNLKRIEISHFVPTATSKQNVAKNNANAKETLLTKRKRNKSTSSASSDYLQNSGKKRIQNKSKSLSSSKNRVVKLNRETDNSNHSNKSHHKENESKQLSKKEKSKVWDNEISTSKSQQQKIQSRYSKSARKSSTVHSEYSRRKTKSLINPKSNTKIEIDLHFSKRNTNKKQTSIQDFSSKSGSIKRKLQKSESSEDYLSNHPKSSKLQTSRKRSVEAAGLSQPYNDYSSNTNKIISGKDSLKKWKSDIKSHSYSGAKPKQQTGSRLSQRSRSLPKADPSPPNITHTKQSSNQKSSHKKKTSSSRDFSQSTGQKRVKVPKVKRVSKSNSSSETDHQGHKIKDSKTNQVNNKFSVNPVSKQSVGNSSKKNSLSKSSLNEFNLSHEKQSKNTVKSKSVSNIPKKKLARKSVKSSASSGKKKSNSKSEIFSRSLEKSNRSKDHSSTKLNAGKYANILSYLSTQNKQQKSNRTDKTFESIVAGVTHELTEQMNPKDVDRRFSFDGTEISSVHISHITNLSDENDEKQDENDEKQDEANKYLEYIMFPGESDSEVCLDNPKPIDLNVLENKNSMKRTVKSLSELDVILDVMDQSIEMVLRQVSDVDKKLVISRMRNFVKEKISTDIKRQLQLIQLQNILHLKSVKIKGLQKKYFDLKITNNRLNNKLNEAMKTKVEDSTQMFDEICKQFSEFKKL